MQGQQWLRARVVVSRVRCRTDLVPLVSAVSWTHGQEMGTAV